MAGVGVKFCLKQTGARKRKKKERGREKERERKKRRKGEGFLTKLRNSGPEGYQ